MVVPRSALSAVLVILVLNTSAPRAQPLPARADSLVRAFMAETGAPSLIVGVSRGGVRTVVGYGRVGNAPPDAETRYEIASVTKTFTSLLLADAVVRGEVALGTPVQALLPDSVRLAVVGRPITLADLATHASGLPRLPTPFAPAFPSDPYADYTGADLMAFVGAVQPDSAGTAYGYSNLGAGLLGWVLARRAGLSYADIVRLRVLGPLGLAATSTTGSVALPHTASGVETGPWVFTDAFAGAGALRSTVTDLLTYAEAVARPERASALPNALRLVTVPRFAPQGQPVRVGLGWHTVPPSGLVEALFHSGATYGSVSFVAAMPERDIAVVILSNIGAVEAADRMESGVLSVLMEDRTQEE